MLVGSGMTSHHIDITDQLSQVVGGRAQAQPPVTANDVHEGLIRTGPSTLQPANCVKLSSQVPGVKGTPLENNWMCVPNGAATTVPGGAQ